MFGSEVAATAVSLFAMVQILILKGFLGGSVMRDIRISLLSLLDESLYGVEMRGRMRAQDADNT